MTANIKNALLGLQQAVSTLEAAAGQAQFKGKPSNGSRQGTPQDDLFGGLAAVKVRASGVQTMDTALVARRLDSAIEKVEQMLREA